MGEMSGFRELINRADQPPLLTINDLIQSVAGDTALAQPVLASHVPPAAAVPVPQPAVPPVLPAHAAGAPAPVPARPETVRGGDGNHSWEYNNRTQVYIKRWAKIYYGNWYDTESQPQRWRPVLWTLASCDTQNPAEILETWTWVYVDDPNFRPPQLPRA